MTHKLVSRMMIFVAGLLVVAIVVFTLVVSYTPSLTGASSPANEPGLAVAHGISAVPHPVVGPRFENCQDCHAAGARAPMPPNHSTFSNNTCSLCHAYPTPAPPGEQSQPIPSPSVAAAISHPIDGRYENCIECHQVANGRRTAMPESHKEYDNSTCTTCHAPAAAALNQPLGEASTAAAIPHATDGRYAQCVACHAIGAGRLSMPENHAEFDSMSCQNCHKPR